MSNSNRYEKYKIWLSTKSEEYKQKRRERHREYCRKYSKKSGFKEAIKWDELNKEKVKAQQIARYRVKLKRPCVVCGSKNIIRHHFDYMKPTDVIFLCQKHHTELHRRIDQSQLIRFDTDEKIKTLISNN